MEYNYFNKEINNEFEIISNKYNLTFVDGLFGNGKTSFLVRFVVDNLLKYKKFYANFKINLPNAIKLPKITKHVILNLNKDSEKCLMVLHESYKYFDKRYNMRKENKDIAEAICQIRKTNIDVIADIPQHEFLDSRMLRFGTSYISAIGELKKHRGCFIYQGRKLLYLQGIDPIFTYGRKMILNNAEIYKYYNHRERTERQQALEFDSIY